MIEWIHWMILGLGIDIGGIWMLASPLLKVDLKHKKIVDDKTAEALKEEQEARKLPPQDSMATYQGLSELFAIVLQLHQRIIGEKIENRKKAIVALIIISIGFGVQMWASYLQYIVK